mmetsp:Transcript_7313/g.10819  ORF Transcript_7313/g.10819 Transcript_7313/m.10819 type:complete len:127 (-) Transcript_7313:2027-2407(-)
MTMSQHGMLQLASSDLEKRWISARVKAGSDLLANSFDCILQPSDPVRSNRQRFATQVMSDALSVVLWMVDSISLSGYYYYPLTLIQRRPSGQRTSSILTHYYKDVQLLVSVLLLVLLRFLRFLQIV